MQVAIIIETALAISVIVASSLLLSSLFYAGSVGNPNSTNQNNAVYDIFTALLDNSTYGSCLAYANATCMDGFLAAFKSAYMLDYASISYDGAAFSSGNASLCRYESRFCLPLSGSGHFGIACLSLCD